MKYTITGDNLQFVNVVYHTAAGTAHRIGRTENDRVFQFFGDLDRFIYGVSDAGSRHLDAEAGHGVLKLDTVFTTLDGIYLDTDDLNIIFLEDASFGELGAQIQSGLSAEVRKKGIRTLFLDDLGKSCQIQRLDVRDVRHIRVSHDGSRVTVDQYDLVAEFL